MSSKFSTRLILLALSTSVSSLVGCGGGNTQVASNSPPPAPPTTSAPPQSAEGSSAEQAPPKKSEVSYGGEATSGGNSGGNSDEMSNSGDMADSGGGMNNSTGMFGNRGSSNGMSSGSSGGNGPMGRPSLGSLGGGSSSGGANTDGGETNSGGMMDSGGGSSTDTEGPEFGSGPTMSGGPMMGSGGPTMGSGGPRMGGGFSQGGQSEVGAGLAVNFVKQNCSNCHSTNNAKGGVNFDRINPDIAADSQTWLSIVEQVESGAMPPRNAARLDPARKARVIEMVREALGNAPEATFMERAELAFRKGEIDRATQLFYAQVVTADDNEVGELLNHFRLYRPAVSKPEDLVPTSEFGATVKTKLTTQLPMAVGVILKLSGQVTDVKPIGVNQSGGGGGGDMGGGSDGGSMRGGPGRGGANANTKLETFEDLTGDFGQALVAAYESRRSSGNYGTLFSTVAEKEVDNQQPGMGGGFGGGSGSGFGSDSGGGSSLDGGGSSTDSGGGEFGMGPGMGQGMGPGMGGGAMGGGPARAVKTRPGKQLANGLTYIGKADNINALLKKGVEAGADGIFVVEIEASKNLRNIVTNETRIRFILPSGKPIAAGAKSLKNTDIERAIAMGKDADDVQKHIDQLFNRMDMVLKMSDMPQISAQAALKQLHARIHSDADRLQILAEARLFQSKGFISSEQLEMVYQVVFEGNEGTTLASGSTDDRKLVLASFTEKL